MLRTILHRGPDGAGSCVRHSIGIGMRRLAIIDVPGGQQPIFNEDETIAIVCNGEIYNHEQLRNELRKRGHSFRTHSDVEVILHLYEEVGPACFARLNGMFGVAIADFRTDRLVLARDPFGQKPLYYWRSANCLHFASELKSLALLPDFPRAISLDAVSAFLEFRYIPAPLTIYSAAAKLLPGSWAAIDAKGNFQQSRYFQIDLGPAATNRIQDPDGALTRDALTQAVERHMMSERPLGVFLSGGLDSSAIVACMDSLGHRDIHSYTVGFEGYEENEFGTAREVATAFRTEHHEILLNAETFWTTLSDVVYSADEPLADLTTVPLYCLSRGAAEDLVVVLSGEGSDELLGGYPGSESLRQMFDRHHALRGVAPAARTLSALPLPARVKRKLSNIGSSAADYLASVRLYNTSLFDRKYRDLNGAESIRNQDISSRLAEYYSSRQSWDGVHLNMGAMIEWWLPDDLLHKADRMTMAHSLELRCPFLDMEFASHCISLSMSDKVARPGPEPIRKIALKKAFREKLPGGIALQRKKGFAIPMYDWLKDQFAERASAELHRESGLGSALFSRASRDSLLSASRQGDTAAQHRVWSLIVLNRWGDRWA